jgi:Family of unknown function (DUF6461)
LPGSDESFEWFTDWVYQHVSVTLTFARPRTEVALLTALGADTATARLETLDEAGDEAPTAKVRVGRHGAWTYVVEDLSVASSHPEILEHLSAEGEAFSLSYTGTIDTFLYARNGVLVTGFDLVVLDSRWGTEPHLFDEQMNAAGFGGPASDGPATAARLIHLLFGIRLDQQMLEGPLLSAPLGPGISTV